MAAQNLTHNYNLVDRPLPKTFEFLINGGVRLTDTHDNYWVLPIESTVLMHMTTSGRLDWDQWASQLQTIPHGRRVFVDNSYDPVRLTDSEIHQVLDFVADRVAGSHPLFLSSRASHHVNPVDRIVYFPFCFLRHYTPPLAQTRARRMGCLNRQNTPFRPWLMHLLLSQGLIDARRDVYSVCFTSPYDDVSYADVAGWLGQGPEVNEIIRGYPPRIATHPDGWSNEVRSALHPAWYTAIAIVNETEPGDLTLVSEKTLKAIVSQSCWTSYMHEDGYTLLQDFGFEPSFFPEHAQDRDCQPILDICRRLDTESVAMDYRQQHLGQIMHNYEWFGNGFGPWFDQWLPKFQKLIAHS